MAKNEDLENYFSNLSMNMLIRGDRIPEIENRSIELCKEFIGGSWLNIQTTEDIICTRLTGGLTNQLYKVELKPTVKRVENLIYPDEPDRVAIKIYQKKHFLSFHQDDSERLNDIIILTALSELNVCPRIFGIFNDGIIQEYFECEHFGSELQKNTLLLEQLLYKLAQTHNLRLPIRKNSDILFPQMKTFIQYIYEETEFSQKIIELNFQSLIKYDLKQEVEKFHEIWKKFKFTPKFCHMDFLGSNMLVGRNKTDVRLIDFEYSAFSCRGYDLSTLLGQWGIEPTQYEKISLPSDEIIRRVVEIYRQQCQRLESNFCDKPENSLERMVIEVKISFCVYTLFYVTFFSQNKTEDNDIMKFSFDETLFFTDMIYKRYIKVRQQLIDSGIVDKDLNLLLDFDNQQN